MNITLKEFFGMVSCGVVRTDRGQGSAGPQYLLDLVPEGADEKLMLVTEAEDPDAWRLARYAYDPLGAGAAPQYVAVSQDDPGLPSYQAIYAG